MVFSIGVFLSFLRSKESLKLSLRDVETYFCDGDIKKIIELAKSMPVYISKLNII